MTINLPFDTSLPAKWRIMRKKTWGSTWEILPTDNYLGTSPNKRGGFFHVEEFWRSCIPEPGQATLRFDFGMIDGQYVGLNQTDGSANDQINLTGQIIRIQCAPDTGAPSDTSFDWRTVWLGGVEAQRDNFAPGADMVLGSRRFHCIDLLAFYTKRWQMDRHGVFVSATSSQVTGGRYFLNSYGHPGYNSSDWSGRVIGNRSAQAWYDEAGDQAATLPWTGEVFASGSIQTAFRSKLYCHTHPGNSQNQWDDLQAVEHALAVTRPPGSPFFYIGANNAYQSLLASKNAWPIHPGMTVWDFLVQVFRRQRGRGVAFLNWDSDLGSAETSSADLVPYITVNPQKLADIDYLSPSSGSHETIHGASTNASTVAVDLVGDHRNMASTFEIGDRDQHTYDYVESVGEYIQVLTTLDFRVGARNYNNSLQERWSEQDETDFITAHTIDSTQTTNSRYDPTFQIVGLNLAFSGLAGNGESSSASGIYGRVDFRCSDDGAIIQPDNHDVETTFATSPVLCKIMDDLPIYDGYDYTTDANTTYDASPSDLSPQRQCIKLFFRLAAGRFIDLAVDDDWSCQQRNTPNGIRIYRTSDQKNGTRAFSGNTDLGGNASLKWTSLAITVGLELPHRVRLATAATGFTQATAKRKLTIYHNGLNLWLASSGAIWRLDGTATSNGYLPLRNAAGATSSIPGLLRDDRDKLAAMHHLACSWYLSERRTATWQLKACGVLTSFTNQADVTSAATTQINYPTLGQLVTTLSAGGADYTINTPITKIHFTNSGNGVTTWITDNCDLDFR